MVQYIGQNLQIVFNLRAIGTIIDLFSAFMGRKHPRSLHNRQMLGNGRLAKLNRLRDLVDGHFLSIDEKQEDVHPGFAGEGLGKFDKLLR